MLNYATVPRSSTPEEKIKKPEIVHKTVCFKYKTPEIKAPFPHLKLPLSKPSELCLYCNIWHSFLKLER